jgi:spoIIIJ-associated protein
VSEGDVVVEMTGETVGEAKWAALRELELRYPGVDKSAVHFEVVSEGERGLLGVGYAPARVLAHVPADALDVEGIDESPLAAEARSLVARLTSVLGVDGQVAVVEDDATITVTCSGDDVALLIGRHGQTIDAVQYLLNAISHRAYGDERKEVVVDAAGYRERRRATLEALADGRGGQGVGGQGRARANDRRRAQGRAREAERARRCRDRLRGDGAESVRRRPPC